MGESVANLETVMESLTPFHMDLKSLVPINRSDVFLSE